MQNDLSRRLRVGFLSCWGAPLLGYFLEAFSNKGVGIDCVIFDSISFSQDNLKIFNDRTSGKLPPIPLHCFESQKIPFFCVENHSSILTADLVRSRGIDILINAGTPRILRRAILEAPKLGVLNCHPGLLPKFRGCTCVEWAIYLNEKVGVTAHFMDEHIDRGQLVLQEELTFSKNDTYPDVFAKVYSCCVELSAKAAERFIDTQGGKNDLSDLPAGTYYNPMDKEKINRVVRILEKGEYIYQL